MIPPCIIDIVVQVDQHTEITCISEKFILRSYAGQIANKVRFVLVDVAPQMGKLMAHGRRNVQDVHDIIVICLHGKGKIIALHMLLAHEIRGQQRLGTGIIAVQLRIICSQLRHQFSGLISHISQGFFLPQSSFVENHPRLVPFHASGQLIASLRHHIVNRNQILQSVFSIVFTEIMLREGRTMI